MMLPAHWKPMGVLYVATGERYRREVPTSLLSLREWHPSLSVTLVSDRPANLDGVDEVQLGSPEFGFMDKVRSWPIVRMSGPFSSTPTPSSAATLRSCSTFSTDSSSRRPLAGAHLFGLLLPNCRRA